MPRRPTSLHFPLRHRRASSAIGAVADDTAGGTTDVSPNPNTPDLRTSTTSPTSPTSSVASSQILQRSLGGGSPITPSKSVTAAAALQTRAELRMCVRTDWDYPLQPGMELETTRIAHDTLYMPRELEFSSPANSSSVSPIRQALSNGFATHPDDDPNNPLENPYRFEDPDAVGDAVSSRRERWEMEQREERRINPGLRHWQDQRDAWTGAILLRRSEMEGVVRHVELETDDEHDDVAEAAAQQRRLKRRRGPGLATFTPQAPSPSSGNSLPQSPHSNVNGNGVAAALAKPPSATSSACSHASLPPAVPVQPLESLVPRPPPLISPSHPIRSQITPHAYRSIYTRIVVQGTAPSIPVNLSDVISACVVGWKTDGEWAPRPPPGAPVGYRRPKSESLAAAAMFGSTGFDARDYIPDMPPPKSKRRTRGRLGSLIMGAGIGIGGMGGGAGPDGLEEPAPPPLEEEVVYVPPGLAEDGQRELWEQDGYEADGRVLSAMGRGVRRMGRALKTMGASMVEPDLALDTVRVEGDVPALVQHEFAGTFDDGRDVVQGATFEGAREGTFEQREI